MRVEITAPEAARLAARLGKAMSKRTRRAAVNEVGKGVRKDLPALIAEAYSTSRAAVGARGKAAAPGSEDPRYTLRLRRKIRLSRLKPGARKFQTRRSEREGLLTLKQGPTKVSRFRARKGEARGEFILPGRPGRRERRLGGVPISLHRGAIGRRRERIGRDVTEALIRHVEAALAKRTGR